MLQCVAACCSVLPCAASVAPARVQVRDVLQCVAVCCGVLLSMVQCVVVCCIALHHVQLHVYKCFMRVAVCCSVCSVFAVCLQCVAVCCAMLQCAPSLAPTHIGA